MSVCLSLGYATALFHIYDSCTQRSNGFIYHQNNPENEALCSSLGSSKVGSSLRLKSIKTRYSNEMIQGQETSNKDSGLNNETSKKQSPSP